LSGCSSTYAVGFFHSRVLDPSSVCLAFLRRDPAACSGLHATPVMVCLSASCGLDSTPDSFAHRCGLELSLPACLISIHSDQAPFDGLFRLLSALAAGIFHSRFLDPSLARLAFLSRDSAACSGLHEPLSAPLQDFRLSAFLGPDSTPDSLARRCGNSLALLAGDGDGFIRLLFRLRGRLFPLTCPGPVVGPSRVSSGETLRRALVCTLPLSCFAFRLSVGLTAPPTLSLIGAAWSFRFRLA
jgi:hypothetical protein